MTTTAFTATSDFALTLAAAAAEKVKAGGGLKKLAESKSDSFALNPFVIFVQPGFNCRDFSLAENIEHKDNIKKSISARGFDRSKPVEVFLGKDNRFYLVDGETRLRAVVELINEGVEITSIPVIKSEGKNDAERLAAQFTSNMGKNFNEIEAAAGIEKLASFGWSDTQIAERTALAPAKVARLKAVRALPEAIVSIIKDGAVSVTLALETYRTAPSDEAAVTTLRKGVIAAAGLGKKKVTRKDVVIGAPTFKTRLVEAGQVLKTAEIEKTDEIVSLHLSPAAYAGLIKALGL